MKKKLVFAYLVCFALCSVFADNKDLLTGLDAYSRGDWSTAAESFERVLTVSPNDRIEALYWLMLSETSAQNYQRALGYADAFLQVAPEDERAAEVSYQKGRLLHLSGNYEASSNIFYRFIDEYPDHPKIPSAYYWIGENFYAAGNHTEARKVFSKVVVNYPQSGKVNEARYKIVLIDQQSVREELLRMAGESHTEERQAEKTSNSIESEPKSDAAESSVTDEPSVIEEQERDEYFAGRLTALEEKLDEISATLSRMADEQEKQRVREQQQDFEQEQKDEQQQKEQEEAERNRLEKRRQELAELKERTQTLERLYEERTKGVQ